MTCALVGGLAEAEFSIESAGIDRRVARVPSIAEIIAWDAAAGARVFSAIRRKSPGGLAPRLLRAEKVHPLSGPR